MLNYSRRFFPICVLGMAATLQACSYGTDPVAVVNDGGPSDVHSDRSDAGVAADSEPSDDDARTETPSFGPCSAVEGAGDNLAQCATVQLPLVYGDSSSETMGVHVKRVPATKQPAAAQLWLVAGGPGEAGSTIFPADMKVLAKGFPTFDIYTIDHRGTGGSDALTCPAEEDPKSPAGVDIDSSEIAGCAQYVTTTWGQRLRGYTTTNAAKDIGTLINSTKKLNQKVLLYGKSYGTYLLYRYLHFFPNQADGIVLEANASPDFDFTHWIPDFDTIAKRFLEVCKSDAFCGEKFGGDPAGVLRALYTKLDKEGHCRALDITGKDLKNLLGKLLYGRPTTDLLPALVYRINRCSDADVKAVSKFVSAVTAGTSTKSTFVPLHLHVSVSELWSDSGPSLDQLRSWYADAAIATSNAYMRQAYDVWPRYTPDEYKGKWAASSVPILVLQGQLDPATPEFSAVRVKEHYEGAHQTFVSMPYAGHTVTGGSPTAQTWITSDCAGALVGAFWMAPNATLDTSCTTRVLPFQFKGIAGANEQLFGEQDIWEGGSGATTRTVVGTTYSLKHMLRKIDSHRPVRLPPLAHLLPHE